ncbi:unnamed protein product, partial [Brenthis ino]
MALKPISAFPWVLKESTFIFRSGHFLSADETRSSRGRDSNRGARCAASCGTSYSQIIPTGSRFKAILLGNKWKIALILIYRLHSSCSKAEYAMVTFWSKGSAHITLRIYLCVPPAGLPRARAYRVTVHFIGNKDNIEIDDQPNNIEINNISENSSGTISTEHTLTAHSDTLSDNSDTMSVHSDPLNIVIQADVHRTNDN